LFGIKSHLVDIEDFLDLLQREATARAASHVFLVEGVAEPVHEITLLAVCG